MTYLRFLFNEKKSPNINLLNQPIWLQGHETQLVQLKGHKEPNPFLIDCLLEKINFLFKQTTTRLIFLFGIHLAPFSFELFYFVPVLEAPC
jgi:hypothetical protein